MYNKELIKCIKNINPDPILVDGEQEAIIDDATWEKVQIILKDRSKTHNRVYDSELLLKKVINNINKNKSSKLKPKLVEINKVNKEIDKLKNKKNISIELQINEDVIKYLVKEGSSEEDEDPSFFMFLCLIVLL